MSDSTTATPFASCLFAPLRPWLAQLPPHPERDALATLLEHHPRHNAQGLPLRFIAPPNDGLGYEARIALSGEVETREDNWHDFFNALVWLTFPQAKSALSAAHAAVLDSERHAPRGLRRDALTHFDECGIVVASSRPDLLELLRHFAWRELFVDQREAVCRDMRFIVFGHAIYERLLAPFHGLTGKALLYPVSDAWLAQPLEDQCADLDRRLATDIAAGQPAVPRELQPLPLLGIPGVTPANKDPAYYDDTSQFRPGRRLT